MERDFKLKIFVSNHAIYKIRILYPQAIYEQTILFDLTVKNGKVDLGFGFLEVENNDGFIEEINRDVKIIPKDKDIVVAQIIEDKTRGYTITDYKIYLFKTDGKVKEISNQIKQEESIINNGKYQMKRIRYYVEYNNTKLYFSEIDTDIRKILKVNIKVENGKTIISGNTYLLRFMLRSLKFNFDKENKVWYRDGTYYGDLEEKLQEVGQKLNSYSIIAKSGNWI